MEGVVERSAATLSYLAGKEARWGKKERKEGANGKWIKIWFVL